jgi:hypothetical protein
VCLASFYQILSYGPPHYPYKQCNSHQLSLFTTHFSLPTSTGALRYQTPRGHLNPLFWAPTPLCPSPTYSLLLLHTSIFSKFFSRQHYTTKLHGGNTNLNGGTYHTLPITNTLPSSSNTSIFPRNISRHNYTTNFHGCNTKLHGGPYHPIPITNTLPSTSLPSLLFSTPVWTLFSYVLHQGGTKGLNNRVQRSIPAIPPMYTTNVLYLAL